MDLKKWKDVVIEWVNCLNLLDNKIDSLSNLKDGTFFFGLVKLFKQEIPIIECDLAIIRNILKEQYPNCHFENPNAELVEELSENDLILLASLLLHYSCVIDRREVLTSPLCHTLSKNSQICIRSYLELATNRFSREEFFNVVQLCMGKLPKTKSLRCHVLQAGDSVLTNDSPLQEFLKTPSRSSRLQEKDREIIKLLNDIDMERFEKEELQGEVNLQKQRNHKLSQEMDKKTVEIMRLYSEIADLENSSTSNENREAREIQQRLRGDIISLEKYIHQLEEEQEQLHNERDSIKGKLKKMEVQLSLWHEKAISAEHNFDDLLEKQVELEIELCNYKSQCQELNTLLKELHPQNHLNDSSIEVDVSVSEIALKTFNETSHGETTCAVIEVQFKEVQKENSELKSLLKQCQDGAKELHEELSATKKSYNKLSQDFDAIEENNGELLKKISVLEETQKNLQQLQIEFEESKTENAKLVDYNSNLNEVSLTLQQELAKKEACIVNLKACNDCLNSDLNDFKNRFQDCESKYAQKTYICITLEKQVQKLEKNYDKLMKDYSNTNFNLKSVTDSLDQLDSDMEKSLLNLEKMIFGKNNLDVKNKLTLFTQALKQLEINNTEHLNEKRVLIDNIRDLEKLVEKLRSSLTQLNEKQSINVVERQSLSDDLKFASSKVEALEKTICEHLTKISELNSTIAQMETTISELEGLKDVVREKEDKISHLNAENLSNSEQLSECKSKLDNNLVLQEELSNCLQTTEKIKDNLHIKLLKCEEEVSQCKEETKVANRDIIGLKSSVKVYKDQILVITSELEQYKKNETELKQTILHLKEVEAQLGDANNQISNLQDGESALKTNIFNQSKQHQEELNCLNEKIESYLIKINFLESELNDSKLSCSNIQKELNLVVLSKQKLEEEIQFCKDDFSKRLNIVNITMNQVQCDLNKARENEKKLCDELQTKLQEFKDLKAKQNLKEAECEQFGQKLKNVLNNLNSLEVKYVKVVKNNEDQLSTINQDLLFLKLEVEEKNQEMAALKSNNIENQLKYKVLEEAVEKLNNELEKSRQEIEELQGEGVILENLNSTLQKKCDQLEMNSQKTISNLSKKNDELNSEILKFVELRQNIEAEILLLNSQLAKSESKIEELEEINNTTVTETQQQISSLQDTVTSLNEEIESLKEREIEQVIEIRNIQEELSEAVFKYTESLQIRQELERENESQVNGLTENLHEVVEKYNHVDKIYMDTIAELESVRKNLVVLEDNKIQLEVEMMEQKHRYEEDHAKCISELNLRIVELTNRELELNTQILEFKEACKTSESNYENLNNLYTNVETELSTLKIEKIDIYKNLQSLQTEHKKFKNVNEILKQDYVSFVESHCQQLQELRTELLNYLTTLSLENDELHTTLKTFRETTMEYENKQKEISVIHAEELQQKELVINKLEVDVSTLKKHVSKLSDEKSMLDTHIAMQKENLCEYKKECDEIVSEKDCKIEEYLGNIVQLKSASKILETGKMKLEEEICTLIDRIKQIEEEKFNSEDKYQKEINSFETIIDELKSETSMLKAQLLENVGKSNKLELELSITTDSLNCLNTKHLELMKFATDKEKEQNENLHRIETNSSAKQALIENLEIKNQILVQEISATKVEIENLKQIIDSSLFERQSLNLQIETLNEKLNGNNSLIRQQEFAISEANQKLLENLSGILEIEKEKRLLQEKLEEVSLELQESKKGQEEILDSQIKIIKETENNLIKAHEHVAEVKEDLMKHIKILEDEKVNETQIRCDIQKLLEIEKVAKEILEIRVLELINEKSKFSRVFLNLKNCVERVTSALDKKSLKVVVDGQEKEFQLMDLDVVNHTLEVMQDRVLQIIIQHEKCSKEIELLETDKIEIIQKIDEINLEKNLLGQEREKLLNDFNIIYNEKMEMKEKMNDYETLKTKYSQLMECKENNEVLNSDNVELREKLSKLETKFDFACKTCNKYANLSNNCSAEIDKLLSQRNIIEEIVTKLKLNLSMIQMKIFYVNDIRELTKFNEQIDAFNIIIEDIYKQYLRYCRKIQNIVLTVVKFPSEIYNAVNSEKLNGTVDVVNKFDFNEEFEKMNDCKDRASDLLEQMTTFLHVLAKKTTKVEKENILQPIHNANVEVKVIDEELRRKNTNLKQRLTLTENTKNNLEKKVKQLREDMKNLHSRTDTTQQEISYKKLLHEHIKTKEELENTIKRNEIEYEKLAKEYKEYKCQTPKEIQGVETKQDEKFEIEMMKLREAYGKLMGDNEKLRLKNSTLKELLEDSKVKLSEAKLINEDYKNILEENNKLKLEMHTARYKTMRDREENLVELQKERTQRQLGLQEVRIEYEAKLEKMKQKMVELYRDEFNQEMQKQKVEQHEKVDLLNTIEKLKQTLKAIKLDKSRQLSQIANEKHGCEFCSSRDSISSVTDSIRFGRRDTLSFKAPDKLTIEWNSGVSHSKINDDRRASTLPRSITEDNSISKRNTIQPHLGQNLEMEDEEDDLFNNKYLADLKEGRCILPSGRESNISRLSELKWRNSMCPPHLKSSYPAETQFNSPRQFKEDDIKSGIVDFDDSMSTRLIPGEKPRKKDIGTTSYKKPGPPTPSKNGGRVSLQGNEVYSREVLREHNDSKTPKRSTPKSTLRSLFMGRNSSVRDTNENHPTTPKSKRLSIFRKQK